MRSAHNGTDYGSIPCGLIIRIIVKGTWSSLVYGTYLENKNFSKSREFKSHSARIIIYKNNIIIKLYLPIRPSPYLHSYGPCLRTHPMRPFLPIRTAGTGAREG